MAFADRAVAEHVRAYAQDPTMFWLFERRGLAWDRLTLDEPGQFTGWLRRPADNVIVLASGRRDGARGR